MTNSNGGELVVAVKRTVRSVYLAIQGGRYDLYDALFEQQDLSIYCASRAGSYAYGRRICPCDGESVVLASVPSD